jgi:hypothetical protein
MEHCEIDGGLCIKRKTIICNQFLQLKKKIKENCNKNVISIEKGCK